MINYFSTFKPFSSLPARRMAVLKEVRNARENRVSNPKQLLVDVSVIIRSDAHTGIQRVVRALLVQLFLNPPEGYRILPVFCTRKHGYRYADQAFINKFSTDKEIPKGDVTVGSRDIFLGMDLTTHLLPLHENELLAWKIRGAKIFIVVYDLLPFYHPEWFTPKAVKNFNRWQETIAVFADQLICISETVKADCRNWLQEMGFSKHTPRIDTIPLGAELKDSLPTEGVDEQSHRAMASLTNRKYILMVGTVEPRKGYDEALGAMEALWKGGDETALVIVGKPGWKTLKLQKKILAHPQLGRKLFWLQNVSDEALIRFYENCKGVLMASYGEGFGLPVIEALQYNKPLLVRDIPIFQEILKNYKSILFFKELEGVLSSWVKSDVFFQYHEVNEMSWKKSKELLLSIMLDEHLQVRNHAC